MRNKTSRISDIADKPASAPLSTGAVIENIERPLSLLSKRILRDIVAAFAPSACVLCVRSHGAAGVWAHCDDAALASVGFTEKSPDKLPDIVLHDAAEGRLFLIETEDTRRVITPKRRQALRHLFVSSPACPVFVTAFHSRKSMIDYLDNISWNTVVWVSDEPTHMIHLNGKRFLGPYEN